VALAEVVPTDALEREIEPVRELPIEDIEDLVEAAGLDVTAWADFSRGKR